MSDTTQGAGFATLAIHAGAQPDLAAHALPPYPQPGHDPAAGFGEAGPPPGNPACAMLEERIAVLEGGTAAVAVASGAAARALTFHTLLQPGDEVVVARRPGFAASESLDQAFARFGWTVRWAAADQPESLVEALSDRTKAVLIGSIAGAGAVIDIEAVATIARRARVPLVVDNTQATPYLVRPFEHGADIVLHTATTLLAGQTEAPGGLVVDGGSFSFAGDARYPALSRASGGGVAVAETYGNFAFAMGARLGLAELGGPPSPLNAFLVAAGLETLALRLQRQCDSARAVAAHLARHSRVAQVRYAGLEGDAGRGLALRYCPRGAGGVLAFGITDASTAALARHLRLISPAPEVGGTRSVVLPTAGSDLVRLSIGLEDVADIIADLDQALGRLLA